MYSAGGTRGDPGRSLLQRGQGRSPGGHWSPCPHTVSPVHDGRAVASQGRACRHRRGSQEHRRGHRARQVHLVRVEDTVDARAGEPPFRRRGVDLGPCVHGRGGPPGEAAPAASLLLQPAMARGRPARRHGPALDGRRGRDRVRRLHGPHDGGASRSCRIRARTPGPTLALEAKRQICSPTTRFSSPLPS